MHHLAVDSSNSAISVFGEICGCLQQKKEERPLEQALYSHNVCTQDVGSMELEDAQAVRSRLCNMNEAGRIRSSCITARSEIVFGSRKDCASQTVRGADVGTRHRVVV